MNPAPELDGDNDGDSKSFTYPHNGLPNSVLPCPTTQLAFTIAPSWPGPESSDHNSPLHQIHGPCPLPADDMDFLINMLLRLSACNKPQHTAAVAAMLQAMDVQMPTAFECLCLRLLLTRIGTGSPIYHSAVELISVLDSIERGRSGCNSGALAGSPSPTTDIWSQRVSLNGDTSSTPDETGSYALDHSPITGFGPQTVDALTVELTRAENSTDYNSVVAALFSGAHVNELMGEPISLDPLTTLDIDQCIVSIPDIPENFGNKFKHVAGVKKLATTDLNYYLSRMHWQKLCIIRTAVLARLMYMIPYPVGLPRQFPENLTKVEQSYAATYTSALLPSECIFICGQEKSIC